MWKCLESLGVSAWNHLVLMIKNWRVGMQIMGEQQQLQSLVHELKWSYVALWSFNSGNRLVCFYEKFSGGANSCNVIEVLARVYTLVCAQNSSQGLWEPESQQL